ncbi:hypothetical protein [Zobellia barbeyronii]|uniref:Adhesin domain-containing protein n=1 Tax=Zobellia barbeyronii TaxID=2748009 RepID=A0ABS5WJ50_9FLAO|nr:hypothetical protein [Zobellia barbeyronii]MBT2163427.1 hypothetical protein [Zobellia barbeyronii]
MEQLQRLVFKSLTVALCLISIGANGQKKERVNTESFNVEDNAILDINTSYTDIEFDTWNKNQVSIETTIQLEGATDKEAEAYFSKEGFSIMGNSKKVVVTSHNDNSWSTNSFVDVNDLHIEIPEVPEFDLFEFDFNLSELAEMPMPPESPMPPAPNPNFDHEAFEREGEVYLKKWQEDFQKNFGKPYEKSMEEWHQKMEAKHEKVRERHEKELEHRMEAKKELIESRLEKRAEREERKAEAMEERMEEEIERNQRQPSNTFYYKRGGESRKYKVKKTIKIKMPKSTKIKMNVRHGEVKLAGHTNNMNATLSHAKLYAAIIDGDETKVAVSYTPISVQKWNYGQLRADYSENVDLEEVFNLRLSSRSSEVTIENLMKTAFVTHNFGSLFIHNVADDFENLDVTLQNAKFECSLPEVEANIYMNGTASEFVVASKLKLDKTTNQGSVVYKGSVGNKNSIKSININAQYSEVILQ